MCERKVDRFNNGIDPFSFMVNGLIPRYRVDAELNTGGRGILYQNDSSIDSQYKLCKTDVRKNWGDFYEGGDSNFLASLMFCYCLLCKLIPCAMGLVVKKYVKSGFRSVLIQDNLQAVAFLHAHAQP